MITFIYWCAVVSLIIWAIGAVGTFIYFSIRQAVKYRECPEFLAIFVCSLVWFYVLPTNYLASVAIAEWTKERQNK